jgi:16S rRNA (guanine966-N2)-methyltransferase
MRIVAGTWRGRRINAPKGMETRPTADRVREALFGSLVSRFGGGLAGVRVLDPFAGTGALGLEALSRGAASAVFVESDRRAREVLAGNVRTLEAGESARIVAGDAFVLGSRSGLPGGPFGLILLDPPYRIDAARVRSLLSDLARTRELAPGAVIVWEHAAEREADWPEGFEPQGTKRYGTTGIGTAVYQPKDDA